MGEGEESFCGKFSHKLDFLFFFFLILSSFLPCFCYLTLKSNLKWYKLNISFPLPASIKTAAMELLFH